MERLPNFKLNEVKSFKFTNDQYINLEIEYNRYTLFKDMKKSSETILQLNDGNSSNNGNSSSNNSYCILTIGGVNAGFRAGNGAYTTTIYWG